MQINNYKRMIQDAVIRKRLTITLCVHVLSY